MWPKKQTNKITRSPDTKIPESTLEYKITKIDKQINKRKKMKKNEMK